jgi:hypothetical protein
MSALQPAQESPNATAPYEERMRFITVYFMIYHQVTQMFDKPRFKRSRLRGRLQAIGTLPNLTFHKVTL